MCLIYPLSVGGKLHSQNVSRLNSLLTYVASVSVDVHHFRLRLLIGSINDVVFLPIVTTCGCSSDWCEFYTFLGARSCIWFIPPPLRVHNDHGWPAVYLHYNTIEIREAVSKTTVRAVVRRLYFSNIRYPVCEYDTRYRNRIIDTVKTKVACRMTEY